MFTATQAPGQIAKIENGAVSNPWITLPAGDAVIGAGIFYDRWCVAEGGLIVVSAGTADGRAGGRVWRVNAAGAASLVGTILSPGGESRAYLEGVITVPTNLSKYG